MNPQAETSAQVDGYFVTRHNYNTTFLRVRENGTRADWKRVLKTQVLPGPIASE